MDVSITRRQVLAVGALTAAAGAAGAGLRVASWYDRDGTEPYICLDDREGQLINAIAEAFFPSGGVPSPGGADVGIDRYLDELLYEMGENGRLLRLLLHALDDLSRATHLQGLVELPLQQRSDQLQDWVNSPLAPVRQVLSGLMLFVAMGYCGHPDVKREAGWMYICGYER